MLQLPIYQQYNETYNIGYNDAAYYPNLNKEYYNTFEEKEKYISEDTAFIDEIIRKFNENNKDVDYIHKDYIQQYYQNYQNTRNYQKNNAYNNTLIIHNYDTPDQNYYYETTPNYDTCYIDHYDYDYDYNDNYYYDYYDDIEYYNDEAGYYQNYDLYNTYKKF